MYSMLILGIITAVYAMLGCTLYNEAARPPPNSPPLSDGQVRTFWRPTASSTGHGGGLDRSRQRPPLSSDDCV